MVHPYPLAFNWSCRLLSVLGPLVEWFLHWWCAGNISRCHGCPVHTSNTLEQSCIRRSHLVAQLGTLLLFLSKSSLVFSVCSGCQSFSLPFPLSSSLYPFPGILWLLVPDPRSTAAFTFASSSGFPSAVLLHRWPPRMVRPLRRDGYSGRSACQ